MDVSSVTLLGCGGTGSLLLPALARLLAYHPDSAMCRLICRDGDKFEARNQERQLFDHVQLEMNKAQVAYDSVDHLVPGRAVSEYLVGSGEIVSDLLSLHRENKESDTESYVHVIITAVDNAATRRMVYDAGKDLHEKYEDSPNVIILDPGNGEGKGNLLTWMSVEGMTPFEWPPDLYETLRNPKDRPPGASCAQEQQEGNTQTIAENMVCAALTLNAMSLLLENEVMHEGVCFDLKKQAVESIGQTIGCE